MVYPPVIVVDEDDAEIGEAMLAEVWEKGLLHRTVRIMVEDENGNVLLQRRSQAMVVFPGYWDNSAAGHVDRGMTYLSAAIQEVSEEIGLQNPELIEADHFFMEYEYEGRKMRNFNQLYILRLKNRRQIVIEPHEVSEVRWVTKAELKAMAAGGSERLTPCLEYVATRYY